MRKAHVRRGKMHLIPAFALVSLLSLYPGVDSSDAVRRCTPARDAGGCAGNSGRPAAQPANGSGASARTGGRGGSRPAARSDGSGAPVGGGAGNRGRPDDGIDATVRHLVENGTCSEGASYEGPYQDEDGMRYYEVTCDGPGVPGGRKRKLRMRIYIVL